MLQDENRAMSRNCEETRTVNGPKGEVVSLVEVAEGDLTKFKLDLQTSFRVAAEAECGYRLEEPIPSDADIDLSIAAPGSMVYWVIAGGARVGGAIVEIDHVTQRNSLAFFFIATSLQGRGVGHQAWKAIEAAHPRTKVWETVTPYFEKRSIHFCVNRCGFKVVEFYCWHRPDPYHHADPLEQDGNDEMFRFEKVMPSLSGQP